MRDRREPHRCNARDCHGSKRLRVNAAPCPGHEAVEWSSGPRGIYGVRPGGIASGDLREGPRLANVVAERRPAMLSIHEHPTVQDASSELLSFILDPVNWVALETVQDEPSSGPRLNAAYQSQVGK